MLRAGTLMRITAVTVVLGVVLLLPVAASCEAADVAEAVGLGDPSLTLNWNVGEPGCDLTVTGRLTERGRLQFSAKLACPAAKPTVRQVGGASARL